MADETAARPRPADRLRDLAESYRRVLSRYQGIAALAGEAVRHLRADGDVAGMNAVLGRKRMLLQEIREEEERVTGAREWWKRTRRSLPAQECRELLSLLDAIGKTLEETIEREEECRTLLRDRTAWRGAPAISRPAAPGTAVRAAYRAATLAAERSVK